ncbi:MAG: hypothetical protein BWY67_01494 [Bacteroidetes bacterium ADurb.Bin397]|nr:MAG: hypothetical protein BWY67_01494 [Bacteroidetes bacterium ADurb.Bin397]
MLNLYPNFSMPFLFLITSAKRTAFSISPLFPTLNENSSPGLINGLLVVMLITPLNAFGP